MGQLAQLCRTAVLTIVWLSTIACLCLLVAVIVPVVPYLSLFALDLVPNSATRLLLLSLIGLFVAMIAHARRKTGVTLALTASCALVTLMAATVVVRLMYVAASNGARIDLAATLSGREFGEGARPDESRIYARPEGEALWLDIYRARKATPEVRSPVLFVVHGGGFNEGSRRFGATNMRWFADRGWTVIALDYRLARPGRPTWDLATHDIQCALAWTNAHAAALGIDVGRLAISGASAGGTLAMAAAYATDAERARSGCGARVPRIAALVVKVPLIDVADSWYRPRQLRDTQRAILIRYLGGSPERYPARYALANPGRNLRPGVPPTLVLVGGADPLVPSAGADAFARKAAAIGAPVREVVFPYSGHNFNTTFGSIPNQAVLQIVAQFLEDHVRHPRVTLAARR